MLLRICLIVAILGGLAAATVNVVLVKKDIENTIAARDKEQTEKETAQRDLDKTKKDLASTKTKLDKTTKDLTQTKSDLDSANDKVSDLEKKSTDLTTRLTQAQAERDKADQELSKWNQLNITPNGVVELRDNLKKTESARDAVTAENKILSTKLAVVTEAYQSLIGTNSAIPAEPTGLTGRVVAVDPKYDFVVLNVGDDKGVVPRGIFLIARGGKLIGKVQITRVEGNQSVGTLLPDWIRGDVMEGDVVLD